MPGGSNAYSPRATSSYESLQPRSTVSVKQKRQQFETTRLSTKCTSRLIFSMNDELQRVPGPLCKRELALNTISTLKLYTGGVPQRLDRDVHSVVTAKTSTALWQRKRVQRCDSAEITMCTLV